MIWIEGIELPARLDCARFSLGVTEVPYSTSSHPKGENPTHHRYDHRSTQFGHNNGSPRALQRRVRWDAELNGRYKTLREETEEEQGHKSFESCQEVAQRSHASLLRCFRHFRTVEQRRTKLS